jgi:hypothetical protein
MAQIRAVAQHRDPTSVVEKRRMILIPVPVIRKFAPGDIGIARRAYHTLPLLDSGAGGRGRICE